MRKILGFILLALVIVFLVGERGKWLKGSQVEILSPLGKKVSERPLDKYTYENLRQRSYQSSEIKFDHVLKQTPDFSTWLFFFNSDGKKISGAANLPAAFKGGKGDWETGGDKGIIVMLHGFAERKGYYPGFGTEKVAGELAKAGYVTLAPDFAGYGFSDPASKDDFEDRFQTYTTTLNLIASIENLQGPSTRSSLLRANSSPKLGIWGHSNGGQIALSVLEISGKNIPTVLWNPVSRFFPYNILYYTDQFEDRGKYLRGSLAKFEQKYDTDKYSLDKYWSWIEAPILLQQGSADREVPKFWSDDLFQDLEKVRLASPSTPLRTTYKVYVGADHNLVPGWEQAVKDLLLFYKKYL